MFAQCPEPSGPVSDAPARGARPGSPASNPYKTRPFRVTPAFFLTSSVRACTLTAMLTTTTADGLTTGEPRRNMLREHLRALALYRGMGRDHGWACVGLEALLRTACVVVRSARECRACHGTGVACGWPPCACGVCAGIGFEFKGG